MKQKTIFVIDDVRTNLDYLVEILSDQYKVLAAPGGEIALNIIEQLAMLPDLILLDIIMPDIDGYEVCARLKNNPKTQDIPIIFLTARTGEEDEAKGLSIGAIDYISKPVRADIVRARIKNHLALYDKSRLLEDLVQARTRELHQTQDVVIHSLASLAETRDNETGAHIRRTQHYVKILAEVIRNDTKYRPFLTDRVISLLYKGTPLHDIGKVGIPDRILLKPGKLTDDEFEEIKKHTTYGRNAILEAEKHLGSNSFLRYARDIAYAHHEKWDGSGYPEGLQGNTIPIAGRLMAVADVYDALISRRVYKTPMSHDAAKKVIFEEKGKHFDPQIVNAFAATESVFKDIALKYHDDTG